MNRVGWRTVLLTVLVVAFLAVSPKFLVRGMESIRNGNVEEKREKNIITLWHIDQWEGGINSRATWLVARAKEYEKRNKGVLIDVKAYTPDQAEQLLQTKDLQVLPNMISFSAGVINAPQIMLAPLRRNENIKSQLLSAGSVEGVLYATPWLMGGYGFVIQGDDGTYDDIVNSLTKGKSTLYCGVGQRNSPLTALVLSDVKGMLFGLEKRGTLHVGVGKITPTMAWQEFSQGSGTLFGSQRDVYRAKEKGKLICAEKNIYTDEVQYLGIINKKDNWEECQGFIDYILEPQCQAKLESLGLISVLNKQQNVYGNENIQRLNHSLSNDFYTCSAFMKKDELNRVNDAAIGYLMGSDEAKKAIEEYKSRCFMQ